ARLCGWALPSPPATARPKRPRFGYAPAVSQRARPAPCFGEGKAGGHAGWGEFPISAPPRPAAAVSRRTGGCPRLGRRFIP
ncbi:unnamed protein product, partial [Bubo scandiacus]